MPETLVPGTGHEMVTVSTRDGDSLVLTHDCAADNQPRMRCRPGADAKALKFEFPDATGLASPEAPHMHARTRTLAGEDRMRAVGEWYNQGVRAREAAFELERAGTDAR